jgi:protein gp37
MAAETLIAWTDRTFNAWMGCVKVSAGCANCYAETLTKNRMGLALWGKDAARQVTKEPWRNVTKWNREAAAGAVGVRGPELPLLVFTGSLMDWAEDRPDLAEPRRRMWELIRDCQSLDFQLLTKRPENIAKFLPGDWGDGYANVWLGTSIEDLRVAERREHLAQIPAAVRFVSYEPALGPLDDMPLDGIDWVIYGGESGPGYRPEDKDWARSMHRKCAAAGVAFFHKQSSGHRTELGIELDGKIVREFPTPRRRIEMTPEVHAAALAALEQVSVERWRELHERSLVNRFSPGQPNPGDSWRPIDERERPFYLAVSHAMNQTMPHPSGVWGYSSCDELALILRVAQERERFALTAAQSRSTRPAKFDNSDRVRQPALFDGLDCLPGQQDLFA